MPRERRRYTVVISDKATEMILSHVRFVAQVSEEAAENLAEDYYTAAKSLEQLPERNPRLLDPDLPPEKYRKMLVKKRYLLIYQVKGSTVYIDFVVDCRQDYRWLLE